MAHKMSQEARELRNAYARERYAKNKERERQRQVDFWERKAQALKAKGNEDS